MTIGVDFDGLAKISSKLTTAGEDLSKIDVSGFGEVDAGIVSEAVTSALAEFTRSAGTIAEASASVGALVTTAAKYYREVDMNVEATLTEMSTALQGRSSGD